MPLYSNLHGGSVALALHLRKSRSSCCHYCIPQAPANMQRGILTAASRQRSVGRSACSENNIWLSELAFPEWRRDFSSDREPQVKRRHHIFPQKAGVASLSR